jgi:hypothetical protein
MSRFYHIEIARHAADAEHKWVDNLLSHFDIPGVEGRCQGVARRISLDGIHHVALIRRLNRELRIPVATAVSIACRLLASHSGREDAGPAIAIHLDRAVLRQEIDRRVADAVEASTPARRGRPPRRAIA